MKCSKCGREMEEGEVIRKGLANDPNQFWTTGVSFLKGFENKHIILVYRCKSCGYLESYAK